MPRLLGVDIPDNKRIDASLPSIYGIGRTRSREILSRAAVDPAIRANKLTPEQLNRISSVITEQKYVVEGDLRREIQQNIRRLMAIGSYRGIRHKRGLPVRGQRTSTNARTRKGPRKTVGVIRSKDAKTGKV